MFNPLKHDRIVIMARLGQIIKKLNIGISTATEFLNKKGEAVEQNPHVQLTENQENLLFKEFSSDKTLKEKSDKLIQKRLERETLATLSVEEEPTAQETKEPVEKEAKTEKNCLLLPILLSRRKT